MPLRGITVRRKGKAGEQKSVRRHTTSDVLDGLMDVGAKSTLGRFCVAIFSSTVQMTRPTKSQMKFLEEMREDVRSDNLDDHERRFGICYLSWRQANLSIAILSMVIRVGFNAWSVALAIIARVNSTLVLKCRDAICGSDGSPFVATAHPTTLRAYRRSMMQTYAGSSIVENVHPSTASAQPNPSLCWLTTYVRS